ncbi:MAG: metallophosphoesterase [Methanimicrococcus sp.]|nr:metallophosphoesterase [Methanimicrococcus sp.]
MKILVISDTHLPKSDSLKNAADFSFFPELLQQKIKDADLIIHAGDFESEEAYRLFEQTNKLKAVHGNRDEEFLQRLLPKKLIFEQNGFKFGVIHEAGVSLNDNTARWYVLKEMGVDILIYGHIHTPSIDEYKNTFLICPGSPTKARMSEPSVVEIELDDTQAKTIKDVKIIPVAAAACGYLKFQDFLENKKE